MTLGDISNLILTTLQQPGASFTVGGGGGPNWGQGPPSGTGSSPQFSQGLVEFCINEGYRMLMGDLEDLELSLISFTLNSTVNTFKYAIPPANYAPISHVARVFYQPKGLPYIREFTPGYRLISWSRYQTEYSAEGYLSPYSFGTEPKVVTVDPLLSNLYFNPGSAVAGDTITVEYQPLPAIGATGCPTLVAATDKPLLPLDLHMGIFYFAMHLLWTRAREAQMAMTCYNADLNKPSMYGGVVSNARRKYTKKHHGDSQRVYLDFPIGYGSW